MLLGDKFVEPGYKATDKEDGDVTEQVTVSIVKSDMLRKINEKQRAIYSTDLSVVISTEEFMSININTDSKLINNNYLMDKNNFYKIDGEFYLSHIDISAEYYLFYQINNLPDDKKTRDKYIEIGNSVFDSITKGSELKLTKEEQKIADRLNVKITCYCSGIAENGVKIEKKEDLENIKTEFNKMWSNSDWLKRANTKKRTYSRYNLWIE